MAPGVATSLTAAVVAVFGGRGLWQQQGMSRRDVGERESSTSLALLSPDDQPGVGDSGSRVTVDEHFAAHELPTDTSGIAQISVIDFGHPSETDQIEPDFEQQPEFATASAPALDVPDTSEALEWMTGLLQEASLPPTSAHKLPESPLFSLGIALGCILVFLLHWHLKRSMHRRRHHGQLEVEQQQDVQIVEEMPGIPERTDTSLDGEVDGLTEVAPTVLIADPENESVSQSGPLAVDALNDGVVQSEDDLSLLLSDTVQTAGDVAAAQSFVGDISVAGAVVSAQIEQDSCPLMPTGSAVPVATAAIATETYSQLSVLPDDALEQESVRSDCVLNGEVLNVLSSVLDEEASTAHAVHAGRREVVECHGENVQRVTPPSSPCVISPGLKIEKANIQEDDKASFECTLRGLSTPNRHRSADIAECTQHAKF